MRNNRGLGQYGLGNIDLYARPQVKMPDGSIATVRSMSFNDGLKEVLIPTVSDDGRILSDNEAIDNYYKTGKYLGKFNTVDEATKYAQQLHNEQDRHYNRDRANATTNTGAISFQNLANQIMRSNPYIQQLQQQYLDTYNGR